MLPNFNKKKKRNLAKAYKIFFLASLISNLIMFILRAFLINMASFPLLDYIDNL